MQRGVGGKQSEWSGGGGGSDGWRRKKKEEVKEEETGGGDETYGLQRHMHFGKKDEYNSANA